MGFDLTTDRLQVRGAFKYPNNHIYISINNNNIIKSRVNTSPVPCPNMNEFGVMLTNGKQKSTTYV